LAKVLLPFALAEMEHLSNEYSNLSIIEFHADYLHHSAGTRYAPVRRSMLDWKLPIAAGKSFNFGKPPSQVRRKN
jgi:hypothetical protein